MGSEFYPVALISCIIVIVVCHYMWNVKYGMFNSDVYIND